MYIIYNCHTYICSVSYFLPYQCISILFVVFLVLQMLLFKVHMSLLIPPSEQQGDRPLMGERSDVMKRGMQILQNHRHEEYSRPNGLKLTVCCW